MIEPDPETTLAVVGVTAEGLQFSVGGAATTAYELQVSIDLGTWVALATVTTDDTGNVVFTDADSAAALSRETWAEGNRFYRAVVAPDDGGE